MFILRGIAWGLNLWHIQGWRGSRIFTPSTGFLTSETNSPKENLSCQISPPFCFRHMIDRQKQFFTATCDIQTQFTKNCGQFSWMTSRTGKSYRLENISVVDKTRVGSTGEGIVSFIDPGDEQIGKYISAYMQILHGSDVLLWFEKIKTIDQLEVQCCWHLSPSLHSFTQSPLRWQETSKAPSDLSTAEGSVLYFSDPSTLHPHASLSRLLCLCPWGVQCRAVLGTELDGVRPSHRWCWTWIV